jgi:hypothetical protein
MKQSKAAEAESAEVEQDGYESPEKGNQQKL